MQAAITIERPTLAVHLTHTLDTARTWSAAWSRFDERSGGALRSATSAIPHLDRYWNPHSSPPDAVLLDGTRRGQRSIDIIVSAG